MNPDFELNDNVGRTTDQIHAAHLQMATADDLRRWADRDGAAFRKQHGLDRLPAATLDPSPYLRAFEAARTPAEASAVTNALLDAVEPVIEAAVTYLSAAAEREKPTSGRDKNSPAKMLYGAASSLRAGLGIAAEADEKLLRAEYDSPPTSRDHQLPSPPSRGIAPAPPGPRPRGPRP